jgi:hypothetical protein
MRSVVCRVSRGVVVLGALALLASACGSDVPVERSNVSIYDRQDQRIRDRYGTITGRDGFTIFGAGRGEEDQGGGGIGVNSYLWRATLETIDFMPLASADPFGGLIITDWYQPPSTPTERLKLQVLIRDTALRADGIKVSVFRQVREGEAWVDSAVDEGTAGTIEDKILTRARQLRIATAEAGS